MPQARYADLRLQRRARHKARPLDHRTEDSAGRVAAKSIELIRAHGLDVWVYRGNDWLVAKAGAPHVAHEAWTVKFEPKIVTDVAARLDQVSKVVGVSDDLDAVQRCEADARTAFGQLATANRSQPYYLDVTNKDANKGAVVDFLSRRLGVPVEEIATIGDQPTDVPMFSARASASRWAMRPTRSRRRPALPRIPTTTKVSPRRWNASSGLIGSR